MIIKYLVEPYGRNIVAELTPEKEIKISDSNLLYTLQVQGITVEREFKEKYALKEWRVYPKDDPSVFAKAFELFYFIYGLQQLGYKWMSKKEIDKINEWKNLSDEEAAKKLIEEHKIRCYSTD